MKKILCSVFALGMMTSVAMAAPAEMTDAQMDAVTAGATTLRVNQSIDQYVVGDNNRLIAVNVAVVIVKDDHKKDKKFDRKHRKHHKKFRR
jgi:hypothetical protein